MIFDLNRTDEFPDPRYGNPDGLYCCHQCPQMGQGGHLRRSQKTLVRQQRPFCRPGYGLSDHPQPGRHGDPAPGGHPQRGDGLAAPVGEPPQIP